MEVWNRRDLFFLLSKFAYRSNAYPSRGTEHGPPFRFFQSTRVSQSLGYLERPDFF